MTSRGQAIVEFAIVLPILLMVLVGVLEVGRMIFIYAAVTNASREAARYGSAVGLDTGTDGNHYQKFKYCEGIRSMAQRSAYFMNLDAGDILIQYDNGPSTSAYAVCDAATGEDADVNVNSGTDLDRVVVTVTARYDPLLRLVPISGRDVVSSSARTILGIYNLSSGESSSSIPSSGGGGG
ncbi:MAG: pilus assembly protein, partial [Chloroflexota bacterium]|nr:pilus assembly protein [Chloroflexota bacterium]